MMIMDYYQLSDYFKLIYFIERILGLYCSFGDILLAFKYCIEFKRWQD